MKADVLLWFVKFYFQQYQGYLMDTAGQEDFAQVRELSYPGTHCFVLCFSLISNASFKNLTEGLSEGGWIQELRQGEPSAKILLVGTKADLKGKEDNEGKPYEVSWSQMSGLISVKERVCGWINYYLRGYKMFPKLTHVGVSGSNLLAKTEPAKRKESIHSIVLSMYG